MLCRFTFAGGTDSLFCEKATPVAACHWHVAKSRLSSPLLTHKQKPTPFGIGFYLATRNGLEPSTSSVTGWRANRLHHRARTFEIITDEAQFVKRKI